MAFARGSRRCSITQVFGSASSVPCSGLELVTFQATIFFTGLYHYTCSADSGINATDQTLRLALPSFSDIYPKLEIDTCNLFYIPIQRSLF